MLTELFVNNLLVAYDRSGLNVFLSAPLQTNNMEEWQTYGQLVKDLNEFILTTDNEELQFFGDVLFE